MLNRILKIACFSNTSAALLVENLSYPKIYLPSNKEKDTEIILKEIPETDFIICFGQKPVIKDQFFIELQAKDSHTSKQTNFPYKELGIFFEQNNISYKLSSNPGTSYCNSVYWNTLKYIEETNQNCKFLFIHVPFEKNISDINTVKKSLEKSIEELLAYIFSTEH